ncbi:MAG: hypothetical protein U1D30_23855 [Planctomycetota bacterium]
MPIQAFDPISLGVLKRPGEYGVDVAVAEGQSLGIPMSFGGPFLGIFACREKYVRRYPAESSDKPSINWRTCVRTDVANARTTHSARKKRRRQYLHQSRFARLRATVYLALMGPRG